MIGLPSTVQTRRVLSKFEKDLFHLESSGKCLDKDSTSNCTGGNANIRLREVEDIVPETGFTIMLHLGKVEIGAGTTGKQFLGIVEEIEREVEDRCGYRCIIDGYTGLVQMPATRSMRTRMLSTENQVRCSIQDVPDDQSSWFFDQFVLLSAGLEVNLPTNGIAQVYLASDHIGECR